MRFWTKATVAVAVLLCAVAGVARAQCVGESYPPLPPELKAKATIVGDSAVFVVTWEADSSGIVRDYGSVENANGAQGWWLTGAIGFAGMTTSAFSPRNSSVPYWEHFGVTTPDSAYEVPAVWHDGSIRVTLPGAAGGMQWSLRAFALGYPGIDCPTQWAWGGVLDDPAPAVRATLGAIKARWR